MALATCNPYSIAYAIQREGTKMTIFAATWCPARHCLAIAPVWGLGERLQLSPAEVVRQYIAAARVAKQVRSLQYYMEKAAHPSLKHALEARRRLLKDLKLQSAHQGSRKK